MGRNIQQLPNTVYTPETAEVYTTTGFNAGDLVYYYKGNYVNPSAFTSVAGGGSQSISYNNPKNYNWTQSIGYVSQINNWTYSTSDSSIISSYGGRGRTSAIDKNNGFVWNFSFATNGTPYYMVCSQNAPSGNTSYQFSPNNISSTYLNTASGSIGSLTLSNGNILAYWVNSTGGTANSVNYAIYNPVTSYSSPAYGPTQDTNITVGSTSSLINGVALANGGFVLAVKNASGVIYYRGYTATGTPSYAWTSSGITANSLFNMPGMATRSDSSIIMFDLASGGTNYTYAIANSSGTITVSATSFAPSASIPNSCVDATCLSDGSTFVLSYVNVTSGSYRTCFRLLPTSNTLGSEVVVANSTVQNNSTVCPTFTSVLGLSASTLGGFCIAFTDGTQTLQYAYYSASGAVVSQNNGTVAIPYVMPGSYVPVNNYVQIIEYTNTAYTAVTFLWQGSPYNTIGRATFIAQSYTSNGAGTGYLYFPVPQYASGNNSYSYSDPYSGPYYSTLTPTKMQFALSNGTNSNLVTMGQIGSPLSINSAVAPRIICGVSSCANGTGTTNGTQYIYYINGATYYVESVNNAGSLISGPTSFGNNPVNVGYNLLRICGNDVGTANCVLYCYYTNSTTLFFASASTNSTSLTYSTTISTTTPTVTSSACVATLWNAYSNSAGGAVVVFTTASALNYQIYSYGGQIFGTVSITSLTPSTIYSLSVGSLPYFNTDFAVVYTSSSGVVTMYCYGGTDYIYPLLKTITVAASGGTQLVYAKTIGLPNGNYLTTYATSTSNLVLALVNQESGTVINTVNITCASNLNNYNLFDIKTNPNGDIVLVYVNASSQLVIRSFTASLQSITYPATDTINTGISVTTSNSPNPTIFGFKDSTCSIIYTSNSNSVTWTQYVTRPQLFSFTEPSGQSSSTSYVISPVNGTSATSINGAVLAGVALTNASANSTGQIQINGLAQLNSTYTNTATGSFDYTGQAVDGVKGTYNGQIVNLQGNS